jgi:hypothetical protein
LDVEILSWNPEVWTITLNWWVLKWIWWNTEWCLKHIAVQGCVCSHVEVCRNDRSYPWEIPLQEHRIWAELKWLQGFSNLERMGLEQKMLV